jgi:putative peptidoglycan lipid II flippase
VSYLLLRARLGGLETGELVRFLVRLFVAAVISTAAAWALGTLLPGRGDDVSHVMAGVRLVVLSAVDVGIFVALARILRLHEVTTVLDTVIHRFAGARDS